MFRRLSITLTVVLCLATPLAAQRTRLLRPAAEDVVAMNGSQPGKYAILGSKAYFIAFGPEGYELRWTDGTNVGLVKDIIPGSIGAAISRDVATLGDHVYFFVNSGGGSFELWKSDGSADGTVKVKNITTYTPYGFWKVGNLLFFHLGDTIGPNPVEMWRTDGTAAGTFGFQTFFGAGDGKFGNLTPSGNYLYYTSGNGGLFRANGNLGGALDLHAGPVRYLADLNGTLYFGNPGATAGLWKSDGTVEGTVEVKANFPFDYVTRAGDHLYFRGFPYNQLWKSDGTNAGTTLLKDFAPYPYFHAPRAVGSRVFLFLKHTSGTGYWLVATDGTPEGIGFLKLIEPFNNDTMHGMAAGDLYYFGANDGVHGTELWRSDATPGGTFMVKDIDWRRDQNGDPYWSGLTLETYWNGLMLFSAIDVHGREPWRSDGTPNGTFMLANVNPDGTFAGRVTDTNGAGVAGAKVSVWRRNNDDTLEKATDYPVDAQGFYSAEGLSAGTYIAKVEAADYVKKFYDGQICGPCPTDEATGIPVTIGSTTSNINFSLERTGAITGTVRNLQTQVGVGGITVNFSDEMNGFVYGSAVTDSDGRYTTTTTLPPGVYAAWTTGTTSYAASEYIGFYCGVGRGADDFTPIPVEPAQTTQAVDFVVNPTGL